MKTTLFAGLAAALFALAPVARAHITIEPAMAAAGAYQKLTFRVGHGCEGSATTAISVQIPEGVASAKPMPKTGWTLAITEGKLAVPVQSHGKTVTTAVREIGWRGGPLPDAWYDEFTMQVKLPDAPGRYVFKVGQQCEKGRTDWIEVATPGAKSPAPVLEVMPADPGSHHH
jgi:uncharacterized protein YcnI